MYAMIKRYITHDVSCLPVDTMYSTMYIYVCAYRYLAYTCLKYMCIFRCACDRFRLCSVLQHFL